MKIDPYLVKEKVSDLRMTKQRRAILDVLENTDSHPTADEVYRRVRDRLPRVSLGTVYRNLEILSDNNRILKLELNGTRKRFDGRLSPHYHLTCRQCGKVIDLELEPISEIEEKAAQNSGCLITGHDLVFKGLCPRCRENIGN